ncbi:MAG: chorismate-binding protein, partial [Actinomycetota bacterium]|nr:chorismate-binding protein [Actinomycetota bacterium]
HIGEVLDVVQQAEAAAQDGLWSVGFVAYEAAPAFDPMLPVRTREPGETLTDLPLAWFGLFRERLDVNPFVGAARADESPYTVSPWIPTMDEDSYEENVHRIRRLINSGDLTQINYALRLDAAISGDLREFYRDLVLSQRGGNGAFLALGRYRILSASPERFFAIEGSRINVRPTKGTAPRGRWSIEDDENAARLSASKKDRDEHQQIVDRVKEELIGITVPDSIQIHGLMGLERLETVWQFASDMSADLVPTVGVVDVFRSLFPSAAVTGEPKARAMEAIATLESRTRGVYAGAIGYMAPTDGGRPDASFSVAIRTVTVDAEEGVGEYGVGAGITKTSVPAGEYEEAQAKTRILVQRRPEISLFEAIRWEEGHGFWWLDRHLQRIGDSAAYFGFRFDEASARDSLEEAVVEMNGSHAVRLEVDRLGRAVVTADHDDLPPARWWPNPGNDPVMCAIDTTPISSKSIYRFHKTSARRPYNDRSKTHADVGDVLMVNERGELTEATSYNVAVQCAGTWITPPLASGCLPGVLRQVLIDEGVLVEEVVMVDDLDGADGIGLLSSVRGWRPARLVRR